MAATTPAPSDTDLPDESSEEEGNKSETLPLASFSKSLNKAMAKKGMILSEFILKPNIYENNNECEFDLVSPNSVEEDKRPDNAYICELAIKHPDKVEIYQKALINGRIKICTVFTNLM